MAALDDLAVMTADAVSTQLLASRSHSVASVVAAAKALTAPAYHRFLDSLLQAVAALTDGLGGDGCDGAAAGTSTEAAQAMTSRGADMVAGLLAHGPTAGAAAAVVAAAAALHDLLVVFDESASGAAARESVLRLCEAVYSRELEGREAVVPFAVALRLDESLRPGAKDAAVKRVWALRSAFALFDYDDESTAPVRDNETWFWMSLRRNREMNSATFSERSMSTTYVASPA